MLTIAALGMFVYGVFSIAWERSSTCSAVRSSSSGAELGLMLFGALLVLAAAFVRVRLPGGLAFAIGAMLGLQALAVHDAAHLGTGIAPEIVRGTIALVLVATALPANLERKAG